MLINIVRPGSCVKCEFLKEADMMRMRFSRFFIAASLLFSATVCAQEAYTSREVSVRAGPARDYPLVATLAPGTPVSVAGCETDYQWCDIIYGDIRGWVYAKGLQYDYQSRRVPIYGYGAMIGLPIITFSVLSYWDNHYRSRPFYRDRPRWENRPYRGGPGFVGPRPREPQFRQPRPVEPQFRQPRSVEPLVRPPRAADPQFRPPRVERSQGQPPARPQVQPPARPQVQQPARPPGVAPGNRSAPGSEKSNARRPAERERGGN
jgi:uncharacterized protein YraI